MIENQRDFYRIMAGAKSAYAGLCLSQGFIGGDWGISEDLSGRLPESRGEDDFTKDCLPNVSSNHQ